MSRLTTQPGLGSTVTGRLRSRRSGAELCNAYSCFIRSRMPIHPRPASLSFFADTACCNLALWHYSTHYSSGQDRRAQAHKMTEDTIRRTQLQSACSFSISASSWSASADFSCSEGILNILHFKRITQLTDLSGCSCRGQAPDPTLALVLLELVVAEFWHAPREVQTTSIQLTLASRNFARRRLESPVSLFPVWRLLNIHSRTRLLSQTLCNAQTWT